MEDNLLTIVLTTKKNERKKKEIFCKSSVDFSKCYIYNDVCVCVCVVAQCVFLFFSYIKTVTNLIEEKSQIFKA
jgi:hypothetical protein